MYTLHFELPQKFEQLASIISCVITKYFGMIWLYDVDSIQIDSGVGNA